MMLEHDINYRVTQLEDGATLIEQPSSVVVQDLRERIQELEGLIRYWSNVMERMYPFSWDYYPECKEVQQHIALLGLRGKEERYKHVPPQPLTEGDPLAHKDQLE